MTGDMHWMPSPGECADGSGNWLPAYTQSGELVPVCPSDPAYARVAELHLARSMSPLGAFGEQFENPCGGKKWRELSNGTYEVEGEGVIVPPAGEGPYSLRTYVTNSWRNFEPEIRAAAAKRDVPVSWILAIIATETGLWSGSREKQARIANYCCWGPMAVMVTPYPNYRTYGGYSSPNEMLEPAKGIDAGAAIMRDHMNKGLALPAISAKYNSGGLCCPNSPDVPSKAGGRARNEFNLCSAKIDGKSYPRMTMEMNNFAILELGVGGGAFPWKVAAIGVALVGIGAAAAITSGLVRI